MKITSVRLKALAGAAIAVMMAATLAGCSSSAAESAEAPTSAPQDTVVLTSGYWKLGTPSLGPIATILTTRNLEKPENSDSGIQLRTTGYPNLDEFYADLARGRVDVASVGLASAAGMATQKAPVHIAGVVGRSKGIIVAKEGMSWSAGDLRGKRIAAPLSTGGWLVTEIAIERELGLKAGEDYEAISAQGYDGAITQVAAGTADYAFATFDNFDKASSTIEGLAVVATPEDLAGSQPVPWQNVVAFNGESTTPELAIKATKAFGKLGADYMRDNFDAVVEVMREYETNEELEGHYRHALDKRFETVEITPLTPAIVKELKLALKDLVKAGSLDAMPDDSFFVIG